MTEVERIIQNGVLPQNFFEPEEMDGFWVDEKRKKIWAVEIDLLLEVARVCKKYNLKYFLMFGSLLGAVRHHGFIPWDDDIDIVMFRKDYEILLQLKDEFKEPYFLQTPYTDSDYFYSYAKLRNSNTTAISSPFSYQNFNFGIFIDIFPIDNFNIVGGRERFELINKLVLDNSTAMKLTNPYLSEKNKKRVADYRGDDPLRTYEKIQSLAREFEHEKTEFVSTAVITIYDYERNVFFAEDFEELIPWQCDYFSTFLPKGYKRILRTIYGNYMELPPKEERGKWHEDTFFNPDISYIDCLEEVKLKNSRANS